MDYLFISLGCISCEILMNILEKHKESWTSCLKIVHVEFDEEGLILKTTIDGEDAGDSPVSRVPAIYRECKKDLIVGFDEVYKELNDANWYAKL